MALDGRNLRTQDVAGPRGSRCTESQRMKRKASGCQTPRDHMGGGGGVTVGHQRNWDLWRQLNGGVAGQSLHFEKTTLASFWSLCSKDTLWASQGQRVTLSLNPGWTQGDIPGILPQGGLAFVRAVVAWAVYGQTALACLSAPSRVFMRLQREQCAPDLSRCRGRGRKDELCLSLMSGRIVSHPLPESNSCHLEESGLTTGLWAL